MYTDTIDTLAKVAATKLTLLKQNPLGFFIGSMMAGVYVGFGNFFDMASINNGRKERK